MARPTEKEMLAQIKKINKSLFKEVIESGNFSIFAISHAKIRLKEIEAEESVSRQANIQS